MSDKCYKWQFHCPIQMTDLSNFGLHTSCLWFCTIKTVGRIVDRALLPKVKL